MATRKRHVSSDTGAGEAEDILKSEALRRGAHAVGIASVRDISKYAPPGHTPDALLKDAKSVIVVAAVRYSLVGTWLLSSPEVLGRLRGAMAVQEQAAFHLAHFIERHFGHWAVFAGPATLFDLGLNPVMSMKLCAELAGLGTRSMAGGIIINEQHGLMSYAVVITNLELKADGPLSTPVCPHKICIGMWEKRGKTPCMNACRAISGVIKNGRLSRVVFYRMLCATRALTTTTHGFIRILSELIEEPSYERRKYLAIGQARRYIEDTPFRGLHGRCNECMAVCPVTREKIRNMLRQDIIEPPDNPLPAGKAESESLETGPVDTGMPDVVTSYYQQELQSSTNLVQDRHHAEDESNRELSQTSYTDEILRMSRKDAGLEEEGEPADTYELFCVPPEVYHKYKDDVLRLSLAYQEWHASPEGGPLLVPVNQLSDQQIADKLGLDEHSVMKIRCMAEWDLPMEAWTNAALYKRKRILEASMGRPKRRIPTEPC